jgi:hypothetical protein
VGRTIPSYRMSLESEIASWKRFRDVLRIDERELFDDLMNLCRDRACADCFSSGRPWILVVLFKDDQILQLHNYFDIYFPADS